MAETSGSERLIAIEYLQGLTGEQVDLVGLSEHELIAKNFHEKYGILPTIGCEVEVKWSSLFPDMAREYFGDADELGRFKLRYSDIPTEKQKQLDNLCLEIDAVLKPLYAQTIEAGIPKGNDAYWEFANAPAYSWRTLNTEVSLLISSQLIPEGYDHSLHVTLGGVSHENGGMDLVLSGLELMNVPPERITLATKGNKFGGSTAWARRGSDGLRSRRGMLDLGQTTGVELRSLIVSSHKDLEATLFSAQMLGTILLAFRSRKFRPQPVIQEIAALWPVYRQSLKDLWDFRDLPAESWGPPQKNPQTWQRWAECLRERSNPNSLEAETVSIIKNLTSQANQLLNLL